MKCAAMSDVISEQNLQIMCSFFTSVENHSQFPRVFRLVDTSQPEGMNGFFEFL
jgi:hypothetical protein